MYKPSIWCPYYNTESDTWYSPPCVVVEQGNNYYNYVMTTTF